jgi:hypothetical protein
MNKKYLPLTSPVALALLTAASVAFSQESAPQKKPLLQPPPEDAPGPNRFGLSYRVGLNINAQFKNVGHSPATAPGPAVGGVPHTYEDGSVLVDISGNAGGETWNWSYQSARQVYGNSIVMSASNPGDLGGAANGDPQHGLEFTYARRLGHVGKLPWGLEAAFGFTDLTFRNQATLQGGAITVDAYSISPEAAPPPVAPHVGSFAGPGPVIFDTPNRLPVTVLSTLDGSYYGFRLGPYLEIPLSKRFSFTLSGGLVLSGLDSTFSFQQSYVAPGGTTIAASGTGSHWEVLPGGYVAGNLSWHLTKALDLFVGAQYQNTGRSSQTVADKRVELDLGQAVFVTGGLGLSF